MTLLRKCPFLSSLLYATKITREENAKWNDINLQILLFMEDKKQPKTFITNDIEFALVIYTFAYILPWFLLFRNT